MSADLCPLRILITRPDPAGSELCTLIKSYGGHAVHFPTIAFAPPPDLAAFQQSILVLGQQDWLIFVSPRAVYLSVPVIRREWPEFPDRVKFAAVGAGTAQALHEAGYNAIHPADEWGSEGLLNLPALQSIDGKKIAIIRGEGGRKSLEKELADRGAWVSHIVAYQRVLPEVNRSEYFNLLKQHKIDVIVCTSFEGVRNLKILCGDAGWLYIKNIPLIVVSERIKILANNLDFQTIWVARNASHEAILEILAQKRNQICQIKQMKS